MKTIDEIKNYLKDASDGELFDLWRNYCDTQSIYDGEIYYADEFDEFMGNITPSDLACKIFYGDFNPNHNYFTFNGYGNLKSSDYLDELIYVDDLAEDIYNNADNYDDFDDLQEFLNEDDE